MAHGETFKYNYAIICRIPQTFQYKALRTKTGKPIDIDRARKEYDDLRDILKNCDVNVIELQEDENYPDCCFIEDCAVCIGGTALIARPGHTTRQGEVGEIRKVLKNDLKLNVQEIKDAKATLDGGDVLFTGKEIFVGIGKRTNDLGAQAVAEFFPEYNVNLIKIGKCETLLHLKDVVNMAGRNIVAVGCGNDAETKDANYIMKEMQSLAEYTYRVLHLDNRAGVDMLYINGRLIHRTREEMGEKNYGVIDEKIPYTRHRVNLSELSKADGSISSMLLPIYKKKNQMNMLSDITEDDIAPFCHK
ncbi:N(G),N(G)-dimethylarginine dimethylaminohydrolase 1 [Patella vulgata]|uniref:N(G),N(G)-dimethylarginine dimethylaminohydrolase 1 n=1 Tax=Patella vulgata TaxID=6465 RepID=UPI00217F2CEA|nr:N(G),N(G)-dimethylarginine dimethylaminohydrolase 1 [Patella vulgata]